MLNKLIKKVEKVLNASIEKKMANTKNKYLLIKFSHSNCTIGLPKSGEIEFCSSGGGMLFFNEKEINLILELSKAFMEDKDAQ